jgi:hypothetical protein
VLPLQQSLELVGAFVMQEMRSRQQPSSTSSSGALVAATDRLTEFLVQHGALQLCLRVLAGMSLMPEHAIGAFHTALMGLADKVNVTLLLSYEVHTMTTAAIIHITKTRATVCNYLGTAVATATSAASDATVRLVGAATITSYSTTIIVVVPHLLLLRHHQNARSCSSLCTHSS